MIAIQGLTLVVLVYFWWAYSDNLDALAQAGDICFPNGSRPFDSIQAAQMFGRLDMLTLVFAVVAITLGLAALVGFRIFHREVIAAARDAATESAADVARDVATTVASDEVRFLANTVYTSGGPGPDPSGYAPSDVPPGEAPKEGR